MGTSSRHAYVQECVAGVAAGLVEGGCTGLAALVLAELARMENHFVRTLAHISGRATIAPMQGHSCLPD